jgi:hypothetical protein
MSVSSLVRFLSRDNFDESFTWQLVTSSIVTFERPMRVLSLYTTIHHRDSHQGRGTRRMQQSRSPTRISALVFSTIVTEDDPRCDSWKARDKRVMMLTWEWKWKKKRLHSPVESWFLPSLQHGTYREQNRVYCNFRKKASCDCSVTIATSRWFKCRLLACSNSTHTVLTSFRARSALTRVSNSRFTVVKIKERK